MRSKAIARATGNGDFDGATVTGDSKGNSDERGKSEGDGQWTRATVMGDTEGNSNEQGKSDGDGRGRRAKGDRDGRL